MTNFDCGAGLTMTNKWQSRIDAETEKQEARLAEWQRQVNEEKARGIYRLERIQVAVILFMVATILTALLIVFWVVVQ